MNEEVTRILARLDDGDPQAAGELLPLLYQELRQLAAQRLAREPGGQTLQPTALVHEAYLRLVDVEQPQPWNSRGHFFAAAAEAMRRILVENARRKQREKHGGDLQRVPLEDQAVEPPLDVSPEELLALSDALERFELEEPDKAQLVKLRYFAGLSLEQAADSLGVSRATACRHWAYAKAWLFRRIQGTTGPQVPHEA